MKGGFGMFPIDFGTPYEFLAEIKQKGSNPLDTNMFLFLSCRMFT